MDDNNIPSIVALIQYTNRIDAEKAKSRSSVDVKFNDATLTCAWHNSVHHATSPKKSNGGANDVEGTAAEDAEDATGDYDDGLLYDDVEGGQDAFDVEAEYGIEDDDLQPDAGNEVNVDYDFEEEDMVDYD